MQEETFNKMKKAIISAPVLMHPDFKKDFIIHSDASKIGAGAVLLQEHSTTKELHPVAFASWLFNDTQRRYSTTEREMLALIFATRKWKSFFINRKFSAKTDHQSLTGVMKLSDHHGRISRWMAELNQFNYKIEYIPGKDNVVPDVMSRHGDPEQGEPVEKIAATLEECISTTPKTLAHYGKIEEFEFIAAMEVTKLPTEDDWVKEQRKDPDWDPMITWLEKKTLPSDDNVAKQILREASNYALVGDNKILCRVTQQKPDDKVETARRVVPSCWRRLFCAEYHDSLWRGAHMGRDKTYEKISSLYYFKNMARYIELYVATCSVCQSVKPPAPSKKATSPLGVIEAARPWDLVSVDLWGPIHRSHSANKYVLTMVDGYSKFAVISCLPNKKAHTIAGALYRNLFTKYAVPERIHSDLGKEFINKVLKEMYEFQGTTSSHTTAYHQQGNAYAERIHKFFKYAVSAYVNEDQTNWDQYMDTLVACYNDSHHRALGVSPSEVIFGRHIGSRDITTVEKPKDSTVPFPQRQWAERLNVILYKTRELVFEKIKEKRKSNDAVSADVKLTVFPVDSLVRLWTPQKSNKKTAKLIPAWSGPYKVLQTSKDGKVYYLEDQFGDQLKYPVSVLRLAEWRDREAELIEANMSKSKYQKLPKDNIVSQADGVDEDSDHDDSDNGLDMEFDDGTDEYVPSQDIPQPVVLNGKNGSTKILRLPDTEDSTVDNDEGTKLRRSTRKKRSPKPIVTAQPVTKRGQKRKVRTVFY